MKGWYIMTRIFKKMAAVLLALILVAGLLPTGVLAAQTDSESIGADLVSLTVYGITPGVTPVKTIKPDPVEITIDPHGYPVYWYVRQRLAAQLYNRRKRQYAHQ